MRAGRSHSTGDRGRRGLGETLVAGPFEIELAALGRDREEGDERVGGDSPGTGRRGKSRRRCSGRLKLRDDVARDHLAVGGMAVAGLHDMRHQRLDLDDLAALGRRRNVDQGGGHQITSSVQAASVTTTSDRGRPERAVGQPAMATIFWLSARRTRVETCARPARGPRWKLPIFGCGFFSLKTWMLLDVVGRRHRACDADRHRHGVAVLDQRRHLELDLPGSHRGFADDGSYRRCHRRGRRFGGPQRHER